MDEWNDEDGGEQLVRLNKYLADHGIASRRKCDELILSGTVIVDGFPCSELGTRINPHKQTVEVDGVVLKPTGDRLRYYVLNKPRGVICTSERREARTRAVDLITDPAAGRIYTVGRLDEDSTGLIILTNDGEFTNLITHPRHEVPKTYLVKLRGKVDGASLEKIRQGVHLSEGRTGSAQVRIYKRTNAFTSLSITLHEGKNREVRRIFARVGYNVLSLARTRIGNLNDRRLKEGQWRPLLRAEVADLMDVAHGLAEVSDERGPSKGGRKPRRPVPRGGKRAKHRSTTPRGGPSTGGKTGPRSAGPGATRGTGGPKASGTSRTTRPTRTTGPTASKGKRGSSGPKHPSAGGQRGQGRGTGRKGSR